MKHKCPIFAAKYQHVIIYGESFSCSNFGVGHIVVAGRGKFARAVRVTIYARNTRHRQG